MVSIPSGVSKRPHERLAAVRGPIGLVVELARIPDDLEQDLRHALGVAGRTRPAALKGATLWICHVGHVVRGVQVHSVPACREPRVDHDPGGTGLGRHAWVCMCVSTSIHIEPKLGAKGATADVPSVSGARVPEFSMQV